MKNEFTGPGIYTFRYVGQSADNSLLVDYLQELISNYAELISTKKHVLNRFVNSGYTTKSLDYYRHKS